MSRTSHTESTAHNTTQSHITRRPSEARRAKRVAAKGESKRNAVSTLGTTEPEANARQVEDRSAPTNAGRQQACLLTERTGDDVWRTASNELAKPPTKPKPFKAKKCARTVLPGTLLLHNLCYRKIKWIQRIHFGSNGSKNPIYRIKHHGKDGTLSACTGEHRTFHQLDIATTWQGQKMAAQAPAFRDWVFTLNNPAVTGSIILFAKKNNY